MTVSSSENVSAIEINSVRIGGQILGQRVKKKLATQILPLIFLVEKESPN
jgi:hypothetical protein